MLNSIKGFFRSAFIGPLAALMLIFIIASITTENFFAIGNITNQLMQVCVVSLVSIGATLIIISGGIDISSGAAISLNTMIMAVAIKSLHFPIWLSILLVICLGTILGLLNGVLIAYFMIPPFITTLASQGIFRGFSYMLNNGAPLQSLSDDLTYLFYGKILGIPIVIYYILFFYVVIYIFLKYTRTGRQIYAVGGNASAARLSGINVKKTLLLTYTLAGIITSFAAVVMACRLNSGSQSYGIGMEMYAIAAAVIGGASLAGGKGNIGCTFIGAMIMVVVQNTLNLRGIPVAVQQIVTGMIIAMAVFVDIWRGSLGDTFKKLFHKKEIT